VDPLTFLDSGPLGLACDRPGKPSANHCRLWLNSLSASGVRVLIPEIIDYEVRRELIRIGATARAWESIS